MNIVNVAITNGQRSPAGWAEMAVRKIIQVSDTAPQPIRDQAHAYQARIERVFTNYIDMALQEERAYIAALLETTNPEVAALVRQRGT